LLPTTNELATPDRVSDIGDPERRIGGVREQRIVNVADIPLTDNAAAGTRVDDNELPLLVNGRRDDGDPAQI
jgi:hypothetical protein